MPSPAASPTRVPVLLRLLALAALAAAAVSPNTPPTTNVGETCTISWVVDKAAGSTWTSFDVDLMTGQDLAMKKLKRVATKLDGTTGTGTHTYACPNVTPNAPIYFYQFTQDGLNPQWTSRFTIASATGAVTAAPNAIQPDGKAVPWGIGKLVKSSTKSSSPSAALTATTTTGAADEPSPTVADAADANSSDPGANATDDGDTSTATSADSSSATSTALAKSTSTYAGPFAALPAVPRILVWVAIAVGGAVLVALVAWSVCCCRRRARANARARESTFGDADFASAGRGKGGAGAGAGAGAGRLPIRHLAHVGAGTGAAGGVDRRPGLTVDTGRAQWDNGLASPRSPYEDEKRGWSSHEERLEMHPSAPSHPQSATDSPPPPGWTAPAHYGTGASHSAISMASDGPGRGERRPLVPATATAASTGGGLEPSSRPGLERQPSQGLGTLAGRSYRQAQEARYTQFNMAGHAYEAEGRAWASEKSPTTPTGRGAGWI